MQKMRHAGLRGIDYIPWGTHFCQFYSSKSDLIEVMGPYFEAGLMNNELYVWIYLADIGENEVKRMLGRMIDNVKKYIESGQLLIIPHTEWYLDEDGFEAGKVTGRWTEKIDYAVSKGFAGLRAAGDVGWVDKLTWHRFSTYEEDMNSVMPHFKFIAGCLYDVNKCTPYQIADVMRNHQFLIIKNDDGWQLLKNTEVAIKEKELDEYIQLLNESVEYDRIKTEFFANISHELRTPINVILSTLQLLNSLKKGTSCLIGTYNEDKYMGIMVQNCYRLMRMVNNLIDLTSLDTGCFEIKPYNCNIVEIVEQITFAVKGYIEKKSLSLTFDTDTEEKIIACDPKQIERIVLNLLSNAVKFTQPGGHIMVSVLDMGNSVAISVKDNGMGIPREKLGTIFERFRQVDKSLTRVHEGAGIGLTIVKLLVEKHDGKILVKSEYGKGSEFVIKLPARVVEAEGNNPYKMFKKNIENIVQDVNIEFSDIYT